MNRSSENMQIYSRFDVRRVFKDVTGIELVREEFPSELRGVTEPVEYAKLDQTRGRSGCPQTCGVETDERP
jgi:hypothetical protein